MIGTGYNVDSMVQPDLSAPAILTNPPFDWMLENLNLIQIQTAVEVVWMQIRFADLMSLSRECGRCLCGGAVSAHSLWMED